ncbi:MAG: M48 family metallopeptidase [Candidatus Nealsonbacteria bacterium]|nr:M48 family metallopeptidase [Candidatus Nealsonbacteria bacterium]
MATLYTQADNNIRKTWIYITGFLIFVILVGWVASYALNSQAILWIAVIYSVVSSFLSYWYSDKIVLAMSRAKPLDHNDNPEIYHLVENLCITAGLPVPKIYILNEAQPNAFAAGRDPQHAIIAITTGLISRLEKIELEGVIAHELSHIGNRDALLQTVVVVLVGVISLLTNFFFRISYFGGGRRSDREGAGNIMMIFAIVLLILAPIVATLIRLAISRKREFLADASGALLTRYPEGLARALLKISSDQNTAHLFIVSPFRGAQAKNWLSSLFMTHPPIEERVKALRDMNI